MLLQIKQGMYFLKINWMNYKKKLKQYKQKD